MKLFSSNIFICKQNTWDAPYLPSFFKKSALGS